MEFDSILERVVEGLLHVDSRTSLINASRRTGEVYLPGVKTLTERQFVSEVANWWTQSNHEDFTPGVTLTTEVPYHGQRRQSCDLVIGRGPDFGDNDWAVEVKHIALVGNNGKNNDFGVAKILSPYLKDRSLIHDIQRLRDSQMGRRKAVIGYCFDYSFETCDQAIVRHPNASEIVANLRDVCTKNDPAAGSLSVVPLLEFADRIFTAEGLTQSLKLRSFDGAWRHPCGGRGHVFGWELNDD